MTQKRSFVDRLMGVSRVDNEADPLSALNRRKALGGSVVNKQADDMRQHLEFVNRQQQNFGGKGWGQ